MSIPELFFLRFNSHLNIHLSKIKANSTTSCFLFPGSVVTPHHREEAARPHEQLSGRSEQAHTAVLPEEGKRPSGEDGDHRDGYQVHEAHAGKPKATRVL